MHINEWPGSGESSAYLLKYDSVHGQWPHDVSFDNGCVVVDGKKISYSSHDKPGDVPWDALGVELVLECSGQFLTRASLAPFFDKGVKKVLVSAPVKEPSDPVLNIVYGVVHRTAVTGGSSLNLRFPARPHLVTIQHQMF